MGSSSQEDQLSAGRAFGRYQIVRHLGTGGMGSVYEATHVELGKRVALKTLLPVFAANADARERFLREGKLAAKLHHPHVVDVTDFGIHEGVPYLVMEFLDGEDLASLLEREGKLFPEQIAEVLVPIVAALAVAHDEDIVHRDLKPENIFLVRRGAGETLPKILDFGISKGLGESDGRQLTGTMNLVGTPAYMAPEQVRASKQLDDRCDQYALGVVLYQCATGRMPFAAEAVFDLLRLVTEGKFARPSALVPGLPPAFEQVILTAMAMAPDDRFENTRELGAALLPFASARAQMVWGREFESKADTVISTRTRIPTGPAMPAASPAGAAWVEPITDPGVAPSPPVSSPEISESSARIENPRPVSGDSTASERPRDRLRSSDETQLESALSTSDESSRPPDDSAPHLRPTSPSKKKWVIAAAAVLLGAALVDVLHDARTASADEDAAAQAAPAAPAPLPAAEVAPAPAPPAPLAAPAAATGGMGFVRIVAKAHGTQRITEVSVEVDGVGTKGKPPLTLTLPIGKHTARVSRTDERGEEMAIDVKKGETVILEAP